MLCLGNGRHRVESSRCPASLLIPVPWTTPSALVLRPLSGRPAFGVLSCLVTRGPAPANSEANRDRARPWPPSLVDSIIRCSASAEKVSTITCILEGPLPRRPGGSCPQPARPLCLASLAHQASSTPGILTSAAGVALGDFMGAVLGCFSLPPPPSGTYFLRMTPASLSQLPKYQLCLLALPENA